MSDENIFCCCDAGNWSKLIGWFQVGTCALVSIGIAAFLSGMDPLFERWTGEKLTSSEAQSIMNVLGLELVMTILRFVMAISLLMGVYNGNTRQMHAWLVFTGVSLATAPIIAFIDVFQLSQLWILILVKLCLEGASYAFFILAVGKHRKHLLTGYRLMAT